MKKWMKVMSIVLAVVMVCALALAGCNNDATPSDSGAGNELGLLNEGVLKVGSEIAYPPFEMFDEDGKTEIGLDIELAKKIAGELGLEIEFVNTEFDGILGGLDAKKYDAVFSALTIRPDRAEKVDFSDPYIKNWQAIVVKKGSPALTAPEEMNGKKIGYQDATTSKDYLGDLIETGKVTCETSEYASVMNAFDDLRLGRTEAVLCDSVVADGYVAREPDTFEITWVQSSDPDEEPELFGIAIRKGNTALLDKVNEILGELEESGWMDELRSEWLSGTDD